MTWGDPPAKRPGGERFEPRGREPDAGHPRNTGRRPPPLLRPLAQPPRMSALRNSASPPAAHQRIDTEEIHPWTWS